MSRVLADTVLVMHVAYIAFVVAGLALTIIGYFRDWAWVRGFRFRALHLCAILLVALEAWLGVICPLTVWEGGLREAAAGSGYSGGFVAYWLRSLVYYDFPPWVFTLAYTAFGGLVVLAWALVPPRRKSKGNRGDVS